MKRDFQEISLMGFLKFTIHLYKMKPLFLGFFYRIGVDLQHVSK